MHSVKRGSNPGRDPTASTAMIIAALDCLKDTNILVKLYSDTHLLCLALISKRETLASEVIKNSSIVDVAGSRDPQTSLLQLACQFGCSRQLLEELLVRWRVERDPSGLKAGLAHLACEGDHMIIESTVTDLLELGFDPDDRDMGGQTALILAAKQDNFAVVKALIRYGADASATGKLGWSVIHYACLTGNLELLQFLKNIPLDWNTRVTGVRAPGTTIQDLTALHIAAQNDDCALEFLLKNHLVADVNCANAAKETALYLSVLGGISRNVSLLLERNADDELLNMQSESPLHAASRLGHREILMIFVNNGCNLQLRDSSGFSPELLARRYGFVEIADFLKERTSGGGKDPHGCLNMEVNL